MRPNGRSGCANDPAGGVPFPRRTLYDVGMAPVVTSVAGTYDPAVPWPFPADWSREFWLAAYIGLALFVVLITLWTYHGVAGMTRRRKGFILGLRLAALLIALLTVLRPGFSIREEQKIPSVLIVVEDLSLSMTTKDEFDDRSRWEEGRRTLEKCEPIFAELHDKYNITVVRHSFAAEVADYDPNAKPDGNRTDFGQMLYSLHQKYSSERSLRGLV